MRTRVINQSIKSRTKPRAAVSKAKAQGRWQGWKSGITVCMLMTFSKTLSSPPHLSLSCLFPLYLYQHGRYPPSASRRCSAIVHSCAQSPCTPQCALQQAIARSPAQMDWRHEWKAASPARRWRWQKHRRRSQDSSGSWRRLHWRSDLLNGMR